MVLKVLEKRDINSISKKLVILYILNITDLFFTNLLLQTGMFFEANKIMNLVINDTLTSALIKIVLPLILIIVLRYRMRGASSEQLIKGNILINIVLIFYVIVNTFHAVWITTFYIRG
ncbi:DUF5658 family protein [Clostridium omnivorum]|uniref:DUF5658 domain-containing protein n=1 Tax=Clostridium omnivorum TaxID=1604902 RepID=A0ABQ5N122_9CLOT|nr:DUF5658 family protein [Clostridium sp. E14]GLC28876.1 hypothetical protein bsdE14_02860 [Clostridium sp. E14]